MQHHLHHGEFVEIGVEQGTDDHGAAMSGEEKRRAHRAASGDYLA
jgi:hypothetical protein